MTSVCFGKLTIIGSDNGLSPEWHQAIICSSVGILLIGPLGTDNWNSNICIKENAFENGISEMVSILCRLQCVKSVCDGSEVILWIR